MCPDRRRPGRWLLGRHRGPRRRPGPGRPLRAEGCVGRGRAARPCGDRRVQSRAGGPLSGTRGGSPDDPTVCDEERARLSEAGWSFSEHMTVQASGREGWLVSGTRGGRRIRAVDHDRSDAWGVALILATVLGPAASGAPFSVRKAVQESGYSVPDTFSSRVIRRKARFDRSILAGQDGSLKRWAGCSARASYLGVEC